MSRLWEEDWSRHKSKTSDLNGQIPFWTITELGDHLFLILASTKNITVF